MAVARKIKTLLTVNILVFVGIILFSVYCRIQDRSEELIQIGRISDQRLRARNGKVSNLVDRQSILQRLERLEDVVYNQLNGRKLTVMKTNHYHNKNVPTTPNKILNSELLCLLEHFLTHFSNWCACTNMLYSFLST